LSTSYYIADGGAQRGPFPVEQLTAQGLRRDSLVWAEGMSEWQKAQDVPALRELLEAASPVAAAQPDPYAVAPGPQAPGGQSPYGAQAPYAPQGAYGTQPGQAPYAAPGPVPYATPGQYPPPGYGYAPPYNPGDNKKVAAGICGILLGGFGVHKYVLGLNSAGTIMLCCTLGSWLLTFVTCGFGGIIGVPLAAVMSIIGLVEGIIYLTKSDAEFYQLYMVQKKQWF
jgi:TM2 domain-containing membrane protein YozV